MCRHYELLSHELSSGHSTFYDCKYNKYIFRLVFHLALNVPHLHGELSSGSYDDTLGSLHHFSGVVVRLALDELVEDWQEECGGLSRSCLSARHEISPRHDDGKAALLHRSGNLVPRLLDVFLQ